MILFLIGLFSGAFIGVLICSVAVAAGRSEDALYWSRHTCGTKCDPLANLHVTEWGERI